MKMTKVFVSYFWENIENGDVFVSYNWINTDEMVMYLFNSSWENSIENVYLCFIYIWDYNDENGELFVFWTKNYEKSDVFNSSPLKVMELVKNDK